MNRFDILLKIPQHRTGVYVIYNPVTLKAYVGEGDVCARLADHLNGRSSNKNLKNEKQKSFIMQSVINSDYIKKTTSASKKDSVASWIVHETSVMFVLRKMGIELYNGNSDGKDNIGYQRSFLYDCNYPCDNLENTVIEFLNSYDARSNDDWSSFFESIREELFTNLFSLLYSNKGIKVIKPISYNEWLDKLKKIIEDDTDWHLISNSEQKNSVCDTLAHKQLTIDDLALYGLSPMELNDLKSLILNGDLDCVVFHKFGTYVGQTPETIFKIKLHDIANVSISEMQGLDISHDKIDSGICFWALRNFNVTVSRKLLLENNPYKKPKYMIMLFTDSFKFVSSDYDYERLNFCFDESIEDFTSRLCNDEEIIDDLFPRGYTLLDRGNKTYKEKEIYSFPSNMVPPIIQKTRKKSVALIVSDIKYIDVKFKNIKEIETMYYSNGKTTHNGELVESLSGSQPIMIGNLKWDTTSSKEKSRNKLIEYIMTPQNRIMDSDFCSFLIAKLEYPYVVNLIN